MTQTVKRLAMLLLAVLLVGCGAPPSGVRLGSDQPSFRARSVAPAKPVVLLVHGHDGSSRDFAVMEAALSDWGWDVRSIDLVPNVGSVRELTVQLADTIEALRQETGQDRIDIVAHSMGGLISRYYVKYGEGDRTLGRVITISTPHHGTVWARFKRTPGARDLRPGSALLGNLNSGDETPGSVRYTSIWSRTDYHQIMPLGSARLAGARNIALWGESHTGILKEPKVCLLVREELQAPLGRPVSDEVEVIR